MLICIVYVLCIILDYGIYFAWQQREYPSFAEKYYEWDIILSILFCLIQPIGLIMTICMCKGGFKHGLKFW